MGIKRLGDNGIIDGEHKNNLLLMLAAKSNEVSRKNLTIGDITFTTDNQSVSDITSTLSVMSRNPAETIDFKGVSGWANANKLSLEAMQDAIFTLRKATNTNEKSHEEAINLLETTQEIIDYDISTGW